MNTSLSGPLLSRFDITLVLQDLKNQEWDARVADHILDGCLPAERDVDEGVGIDADLTMSCHSL